MLLFTVVLPMKVKAGMVALLSTLSILRLSPLTVSVRFWLASCGMLARLVFIVKTNGPLAM